MCTAIKHNKDASSKTKPSGIFMAAVLLYALAHIEVAR